MAVKRKRDDDTQDAFAADSNALAKPTQEIVKYFEEIREHFDTLDDKEERTLLVSNALDEAIGQERAVAGDPACSRVLEALIPAAEPQQVAKFFQAVLKGDAGLLALASSPFGAHVLEVLLDQVSKAMEASEVASELAEELLTEAQNSLCGQMFDFLTNRYATHVARRLLCIMAGRNVLPIAAKSQNKKAKGGALAAKLNTLPGKQAIIPAVVYPDALHAVVGTLLSDDYIGALNGLMYDQNASPFLQGVLTACEGDSAALEQLIPALLGAHPSQEDGDCSLLQGLTRAGFQGIMQDRLSSHVIEAVFSVAPQPLLEEFYSTFLAGDLPALASHPSANFALQAFLAASNRSPLVKHLLAELKGSFTDLLQRRRSGVVAAMLAACARTSAGQADASKALAAALTSLHDEGKGLAETLLTLDTSVRICGPDMRPGQRVRLAPLGCAMLATLLTFPQEFSQAFVSSIGDWSPSETLRVGQDPGGSRVLEALVNSSTTSKAKKKLLRKLKGMWAVLAVEPGGNHVVEACFVWGGLKDKEVIAGELAAAEAGLSATPRGAALMRKCNTAAFKSSSTDWKKKAASDAQTLNDYNQLFGEHTASVAATDQVASVKAAEDAEPVALAAAIAGTLGASTKKSKKDKKSKQPGILDRAGVDAHAAEPAGAPWADIDVPKGNGTAETTKPSKKPKKGKVDVPAAATVDEGNVVVNQAQSSKKHKKPKLAEGAADVTPAAVPADDVNGSVKETTSSKKHKIGKAHAQRAASGKHLEQDQAMALLGFSSAKQQLPRKQRPKKEH